MDPVEALDRIAFLLERDRAPAYRVRAFRTAAAVLGALPAKEVAERATAGSLEPLKGVGPKTAQVACEAPAGEVPGCLRKLEQEAEAPLTDGGAEPMELIRGDCHVHSDWSDGGSPIEEMGLTAARLGHEWTVLTDRSPRRAPARECAAWRCSAVASHGPSRRRPTRRRCSGIRPIRRPHGRRVRSGGRNDLVTAAAGGLARRDTDHR